MERDALGTSSALPFPCSCHLSPAEALLTSLPEVHASIAHLFHNIKNLLPEQSRNFLFRCVRILQCAAKLSVSSISLPSHSKILLLPDTPPHCSSGGIRVFQTSVMSHATHTREAEQQLGPVFLLLPRPPISYSLRGIRMNVIQNTARLGHASSYRACNMGAFCLSYSLPGPLPRTDSDWVIDIRSSSGILPALILLRC